MHADSAAVSTKFVLAIRDGCVAHAACCLPPSPVAEAAGCSHILPLRAHAARLLARHWLRRRCCDHLEYAQLCDAAGRELAAPACPVVCMAHIVECNRLVAVLVACAGLCAMTPHAVEWHWARRESAQQARRRQMDHAAASGAASALSLL